MGSRDNPFVDDERDDLALRRLLARTNQLDAVPPPPDLVTRTLRQLPDAPPAIARQQIARRAGARVAVRAALAGVLALIVLLGIASAFGGVQLELMFGDGADGFSRALLMLQLLAKPLLRTIGAFGASGLLTALVLAIGAGWLWLRLLRRTPVVFAERAS